MTLIIGRLMRALDNHTSLVARFVTRANSSNNNNNKHNDPDAQKSLTREIVRMLKE